MLSLKKILNKSKNINRILSKTETKEKVKEIANLLLSFVVYGLLINYMLWVILGLKFSWYTFPAYGILIYLLKEEVVKMLRRIIHR